VDRSDQSFEEILRGEAAAVSDAVTRRPIRGDGGTSGRFVVVAWSAAALFCATAAAVLLTLSIRDDEAALAVFFSTALQVLALLLVISAGARVASVEGSRWPFGLMVAVVALISVGIVAGAYQAVAAGSAFIP